MSESPVRRHRRWSAVSNEELVNTVARLLVLEGRDGFVSADLERWRDEGQPVPVRFSIVKRFDVGTGQGVLRFKYKVADRLRELGVTPASLPSLDRKLPRELFTRQSLVEVTQAICERRSLRRPLYASEVDDIAMTTKELPRSETIGGFFGSRDSEGFRLFQAQVAKAMGVEVPKLDSRGSKPGNRAQPDWTSQKMLEAVLGVIAEENLEKVPAVRLMASYARQGRMAGVNVVKRGYTSNSGIGVTALQTDAAIAMGWPPPGRAASNESLI